MSGRGAGFAHLLEETGLSSSIGTDFLVTNVGSIRVEREQLLVHPSA